MTRLSDFRGGVFFIPWLYPAYGFLLVKLGKKKKGNRSCLFE
jgi:IS4 transposase